MKKRFVIAIALGLAALPFANSAQAQPCGPNALACVPQNQGGANVNSLTDRPSPKVCFYTATDYKGLFFCEAGMRSVATVPAQWRNKIKSIALSDEAVIRVCPSDVLQGDCSVIDRSTARLQPGLFNRVRSYDIRQAF